MSAIVKMTELQLREAISAAINTAIQGGELPQGDLQDPVCIPCDQFLVEEAADTGGNLRNRTMAAPFPDLGSEYHRIQYLHHRCGVIGADPA